MFPKAAALLGALTILCTQRSSGSTQKTHYFDLSIDEFIASPDGRPTTVRGINGQSPGPDLVVGPRDCIVAKVTNTLDEGTTLHWHGIRQNQKTNGMDGVPYVTQDPIPPGGSMVYNFTVDDPGTFWYHSHHLEQYVDGVSGALIVRDEETEPLLYSDRVLFMKDFYPKLAKTYLSWFFSLASGGEEPLPVNSLINGFTQDAACIETMTCQYPTVRATSYTNTCGKYTTWAKVVAGLTGGLDASGDGNMITRNRLTRLRVIAGTALVNFDVSVDNHYLWVLALDGQPIVPRRVETFRINGGQRVDVALCNKVSDGSTALAPAFIRSQLVYNKSPDDLFAEGVNPGALGILYYPPSAASYDAGAPHVSSPADPAATTHILTMSPAIWTSHLPVSGSPTIAYGDGALPYDFAKEPVGLTTGQNAAKYPPPAATREVTIALNSYNDTVTKLIFLSFNRLSWVFPKKTLLDYVQPGVCARRMDELRPWYASFHQEATADGHRGLQLGIFEEETDEMCACLAQRRLDLGPEEGAGEAPSTEVIDEEEERSSQDQAICRCALQRRMSETDAKAEERKNYRVLEDYGDDATAATTTTSSSPSSSSSSTCRRYLLEPEAADTYRVLEDYGDDATSTTTTSTTSSSSSSNTCACPSRTTRSRYLVGEEYDDELGLPKGSSADTPTGGADPNSVFCQCLMHRRALRQEERRLAAPARAVRTKPAREEVPVEEREGQEGQQEEGQKGQDSAEATEETAEKTDRKLTTVATTTTTTTTQTDMQGMHVMTYQTGEVIQIVLNNYDPGEHPIHIHGRRFYVLGRGAANMGEFNPNRHLLNVQNPYMRDTVTVEPRSWIVIRFADQNPGVWMMHCHIDWHQRQGLGMVFNELPNPVTPTVDKAVKAAIPIPVGLIVGLVFGAVGALGIAAFLAYRILPDLFHFVHPFGLKTVPDADGALDSALDVPLMKYPPGSAPPPPPQRFDGAHQRAVVLYESRQATL
jgi:FtsP/CotA-like multicopper oxidase with cupredoxin domain